MHIYTYRRGQFLRLCYTTSQAYTYNMFPTDFRETSGIGRQVRAHQDPASRVRLRQIGPIIDNRRGPIRGTKARVLEGVPATCPQGSQLLEKGFFPIGKRHNLPPGWGGVIYTKHKTSPTLRHRGHVSGDVGGREVVVGWWLSQHALMHTSKGFVSG